LKIKKDYDILYTNRAQVYVKQGRYQEAIDDCEWALKVRILLDEISNCSLGHADIY